MTGFFRALMLAVLLVPTAHPARGLAQSANDAPADDGHDCSRWPASVFDSTKGACVCPVGMWWNLRGDACLPREHAAHEFCSTMWPGSDPYFVAGGGYRCVCPPPLVWNPEATACRPVPTIGDEDCTREWPGTLPVVSPSGTEFDCRCPNGKRWNETTRSCVDGAPVVQALRGFFPQEEGRSGWAPSAVPSDSARSQPSPSSVEGGGGASAAATATIDAKSGSSSPQCEALLSEIRMRAGAGQVQQSDAIGMKAAIAGCSPAAISEASRVKPASR